MDENKKRQCRDTILKQIYSIHQEHGLFYSNVMWEAFQKERRKYRIVKYKFYIAILTGGVFAAGLGLKYYNLKKESDDSKNRLDNAIWILSDFNMYKYWCHKNQHMIQNLPNQ